jgi:hypothetical protein
MAANTGFSGMNTEELRLNTAKLLGWKPDGAVGRWWNDRLGYGCEDNKLPDYPNSLDACRDIHRAIEGKAVLSDPWSREISSRLPRSLMFDLIACPPDVQCRAFIKVMKGFTLDDL